MQQSATQLVMEDGKASFFAGTLLMVRVRVIKGVDRLEEREILLMLNKAIEAYRSSS